MRRHAYATDSDERRFVIAGLAIASYLLAKLLKSGIAALPDWVEAPSLGLIFGLGFLLVDRVLWKAEFLSGLPLFRIPDLSGRWHGIGKSIRENGEETEFQITLNIKQT